MTSSSKNAAAKTAAKTPAKPETVASKAAAEAKAVQQAEAAEKSPSKNRTIKKHLIENTTEHQKDINFVLEDGSVKTVSIPRANLVDEKLVNGWAVVNVGEIEMMQTNAVIAAYFDSGDLIDGGETDAEVELSSEDE